MKFVNAEAVGNTSDEEEALETGVWDMENVDPAGDEARGTALREAVGVVLPLPVDGVFAVEGFTTGIAVELLVVVAGTVTGVSSEGGMSDLVTVTTGEIGDNAVGITDASLVWVGDCEGADVEVADINIGRVVRTGKAEKTLGALLANAANLEIVGVTVANPVDDALSDGGRAGANAGPVLKTGTTRTDGVVVGTTETGGAFTGTLIAAGAVDVGVAEGAVLVAAHETSPVAFCEASPGWLRLVSLDSF